jgi:hypothetical protein
VNLVTRSWIKNLIWPARSPRSMSRLRARSAQRAADLVGRAARELPVRSPSPSAACSSPGPDARSHEGGVADVWRTAWTKVRPRCWATPRVRRSGAVPTLVDAAGDTNSITIEINNVRRRDRLGGVLHEYRQVA